METGGEKTRWMMAFASLRSYSFAAWLLLLVVLYFTTGDLISLPMSKFIQSVDGQEYDWIFWLGDRGLVGLLFGLGVSVPVALIARFVACRSLIVSTVISVFLLLLAVLAVRAGLSSVVFSFAMFVGLFAVYSVNGFCKTCNWKKCVVSGANDEAVSTHAAIEKNIINQTVKWRSIVSLCFVLLFLIFSFSWYSYQPVCHGLRQDGLHIVRSHVIASTEQRLGFGCADHRDTRPGTQALQKPLARAGGGDQVLHVIQQWGSGMDAQHGLLQMLQFAGCQQALHRFHHVAPVRACQQLALSQSIRVA